MPCFHDAKHNCSSLWVPQKHLKISIFLWHVSFITWSDSLPQTQALIIVHSKIALIIFIREDDSGMWPVQEWVLDYLNAHSTGRAGRMACVGQTQHDMTFGCVLDEFVNVSLSVISSEFFYQWRVNQKACLSNPSKYQIGKKCNKWKIYLWHFFLEDHITFLFSVFIRGEFCVISHACTRWCTKKSAL